MDKCVACDRKAEKRDFCEYHESAYEAMKKNYDVWCDAYGTMSWKEYLEKLLKSKQTGVWVKDVVKIELEKKMV
ncbi:MAG: hypothetical protein QXU32_01435 [Nitrososphaerales archaeon]